MVDEAVWQLDGPGGRKVVFLTVDLFLMPQFGPDALTHLDQADVPCFRLHT